MKEQNVAKLAPVPDNFAQLPELENLNQNSLKEVAKNMHLLYEDAYRRLKNNDSIYRAQMKHPPEFARRWEISQIVMNRCNFDTPEKYEALMNKMLDFTAEGLTEDVIEKERELGVRV